MENLVYKILTEEQWKTASETGLVSGAELAIFLN